MIPMFAVAGDRAANWGLEGINTLCRLMSDPHKELRTIHIAGTNGKGTLAHYLFEVLIDNGYKVGLYTSPHLYKVNERWRINDKNMTDTELLELFQKYGAGIQDSAPTFFELTTALAFRYFADQNVDLAIIETGLGGRFDATNIVDPEVSIITSIDYDHQKILGNTLEKIACEKAGIIKPEKSVIIGQMSSEAEAVIRERAKDLNSEFIKTEDFGYKDLNSMQQDPNFSLACTTLSYLDQKIPVDHSSVTTTLVKAQKTVKGRFEKLHPQLSWYYDGAHNPAAVKLMKEKIKRLNSLSYATVVLSVMEDKATKEFLSLFSEFKKIFYYPLPFERAATFAEISSVLYEVELFPLDGKRSSGLLENLKSDLVIFTGSFYFYPYVKEWIKNF